MRKHSPAQLNAVHARLGTRVSREFPALAGVQVIELPGGANVSNVLREIRDSKLYEYAEPDYVVQILATPNDPRYLDGSLWGLHNTGQSSGVADADIDAPEGWDTRTSASSVIVAVIDTGVRYTHEDLAANMWQNPGEIPGNGIDDDGNGYIDDAFGINAITRTGNPMDDNSHGTHCAGTIGGVGNNGLGVAGVAWNVQIMALKFLSSGGSGFTSDAITCVDYAISKGAHIMSNSWGGGGYSQALRDSIASARDAGIIFVAAAGNSSSNNDLFPYYPTGYDLENIVSVAATTRTDTRAWFTSYGFGWVNLGAPGLDILSTVHTTDSSYSLKSGTSMAAPHVSGALALLRAHFPADNYSQLINRLYRGVDPLPALADRVQTGGRLNLQKALTTTSNAPFNDEFAQRSIISGSSAYIRAANHFASGQAGEPAHASVAGGKSVWWSWTAPAAGQIIVSTAGGSFDTLVGVYTGAAVSTLTQIASNDNDPNGGVTSRTSFQAVAGTTYHFAVDGKAGASGLIILRISAPPPNNNFAAAFTVSGTNVITTATTVNASREPGEPLHAGNSGGASVWWNWTAPTSGTYAISTAGSNFDTLLGVYTGSSVSSLTTIASNDNSGSGLTSSRVVLNTTAGTIYRIAVDGAGGASGSATLRIAQPPPNDGFAQRIALGGSPVNVPGTNVGAGKEAGEPNHAGNAGGASVWWSWTAPASGWVDIHTMDSNFDTTLGVYTGTSIGSLTLIASDDDSGGALTSSVSFQAVAGTTYQIAVDGWNGAQGSIGLGVLLYVGSPVNDYFFNRFTLSGLNASAVGTNVNALKETGEPQHAGNKGGASVWWSWTAPANGRFAIDTYGSNFNTLLAVYTGTAVNALTLVASNDDAGSGTQSRVQFDAQQGVQYQIAVDGFHDGFYVRSGSIILTLAFQNQAPVISAATIAPQPQAWSDQPITVNSVTASDADGDPITLAYQWQSAAGDGVFANVSGAVGATLPTSAANSGLKWRCRITPSDPYASGTAFFTSEVTVNNRPTLLARSGESYYYDSDLYLNVSVTFPRAAIVNEFSQGPSGSTQEWIEFLVLQQSDLRGWTFRDIGGPTTITFRSSADLWASIPAGTLIVVWNGGIARDPVLPPEDLDPSDGKMIVSSSNTTLFTGNWTILNNSGGDGIVLRDASGGLIDGICYGVATGYLPQLPNIGSAQAARYNGGTEAGAEDAALWQRGASDASFVTPGAGNSTANSIFIGELRTGGSALPLLYRFHASSDLVPGLEIDPVTGVISGQPDVVGGGLFDIVIERYSANGTSTTQHLSLLVGSAAGVFRVPAGRTWLLNNHYAIAGTLRVDGAVDLNGWTLAIEQSYASWLAACFSEAEMQDPTLVNYTADPDADGLINLFEYAYNLDGMRSDAGAAPAVQLIEHAGSTYLSIRFRRQKAPTELQYNVLVSSNPQQWTLIDLNQQIVGQPVSLDFDTEEVLVRDVVPVTGAESRFMRVQVAKP